MKTVLELGKQIFDLRMEKGWSQSKMASFLSVSRNTVIRIENGGEVWNLTLAKVERRLAEILPQVSA